MIRYIISRLIIAVLLLWGLITLSFGLVSLLPGDPAKALLGEFATPQDVARINEQLGLDKPFLERYLDYLVRVLHSDLGTSFFTGSSVSEELWTRLPNTLVYLVPGLILALIIGLAMGAVAAYRVGRLPDRTFGVVVSILMAMPEFVLALILLFIFYQQLKIAPAPLGMLSALDSPPPKVTGWVPVDAVIAGQWGTVGSILSRAVLPTVTIGLFFAAAFGKTVRTGMLQILGSPQIEFARACGLRPGQVFRYALTDVRGALMTYMVLLFAASLSGAAIIESVFSWPGIGGWSLDGVLKGDVPVIQGFVLVMGATSLLGYVVLDTLITLLDPRTRQNVAPRRREAPPQSAVATAA
ncbi:ABC transporter permease [Microbacterium arabinogalactanolyticum]|uniref:ABC transporter permease n=1 Tax=Microbacterium arabinogalactanolyticum TaxID=69365 RepID=UPI0025555BD3|nr:ABC transporter permease [Microbacterium arabinogalactanolyticum]GLC85195.1 ABC transporter permease [Microbacterium arabinogalactanolyticum]